MQYKVETTDRAIQGMLMPILNVVADYRGHINRSYTHGDADSVSLDIIHKQILLEKIREVKNTELFEVGCGAGHIWIAVPDINGEEVWGFRKWPSLEQLMGRRVVLITDQV
jgi:hypothetical protein